MTPLPETLRKTLTSYLEGQKFSGVREMPWEGPLPGEARIAPPEPPSPPKPKSAPPLEKNPSRSNLPRPPEQEAVATPSSQGTAWVKANRHPDCIDPDWPEGGFILVVSEKDEFDDASGNLMADMLNAIGFVPQGAPTDLDSDLPSDATRVLVFGDVALQQISTAGMKLQLVRGLWQESPTGRMLATYAPSSVIDSPAGKKTVWSDLQNLMSDLGLEIPEWTQKKLRKKT